MSSQPPKIFISYAHEDKPHKERLVVHLQGLVERGLISSWHDGLIVPGQQWDSEIVKNLDESRVVLMLIGPDFVASDYINRVELARSAERYARGEVIVIPVLVTNVHGWQDKPFGKITLGALQALPSNFRFVADWENPNAAYADIVRGVEAAVKMLTQSGAPVLSTRATIPRRPAFGIVPRRDVAGRDILGRLAEELGPGKNQLVTLSGPGGLGKTTLAAEVARELVKLYNERFVWSSAIRSDYSLSTLLDEVATQLGRADLRTLAPEGKAAAVSALVAEAPTFIVLDNYETIDAAERQRIEEWFKDAQCSALLTSRHPVSNTLNIVVPAMLRDEADQLLDKLIANTAGPEVFTSAVRQCIYETTEANPYLIEWVTLQIAEAREPQTVFDDLARGEGDAAQRVFSRSFNLPQVGDDGRSALLALSLFARSATRPALGAVAGFGDDQKRLDSAVRGLYALGLVKTLEQNSRLAIEGLTRSLARARLSEDERAAEFRQRFVAHFSDYAQSHQQQTPEDFGALEAERENLLAAIDTAFEGQQWQKVMTIYDAFWVFLEIRGYWDEAIRRGLQAAEAAQVTKDKGNGAVFTGNIASIRQYRGEYNEAKEAYSQIIVTFKELGDDKNVAVGLNQLGMIAQDQGDTDEARRLYDESLEIKRRLGNQDGIAVTLHQLAILAAARGERAEARRLYSESLEIKRSLGDQSSVAITLHELGRLAHNAGDIGEARRLYNESLDIAKWLGAQRNIAATLNQLGALALEEGDKGEAARLFSEALSLFEKIGSPYAAIARQNLEKLEAREP